MTRPNKLDCLSLETLCSQVLEFEGKARANPIEEHLSDATFMGKLQVLPENVRLYWKVIASYKHSSLFGLVISDEEKTFYNIDASWSEPKSIIKQLLKNKSLDRKDIKASVVDYIIAGVDTIGNSIIFTIALIAKYPHVQRRLQAEVDAVLATESDLTVSTFHSMKYLRACVMESFRIYPTADQVTMGMFCPINCLAV
jgi:Cytochrome P450